MKRTLNMLLVTVLLLCLMAPTLSLGEVTLSAPNEYPIVSEPVTLTCFCIPKSQVEDMATNKMTLWMEEKTGVHFEWEVPPASESTTSMNLSIASGVYPDFYYGMNLGTARIWQLAKDNVARPLNDLIDMYMPNLKKILEENPNLKRAMTAPDGNIYALLRTDGGIHTVVPQKLFVNTAWLQQLGMDVPSTPEALRAYLQAVKDNDMNGNGDKTDEIPLISDKGNVAHVLGFLLAPFEPQPNKRLNVENGVVKPSFTSDAYREGLRFVRGLVKDGLFSIDSFTIDSATVKGLTSRPDAMIIGAAGGWFESSFGDMSVLTTLWDDYEAVPPLANADGLRRTVNNNGDVALNSFITTSCKYPEVLAKWCDYWYSDEGAMTNYGMSPYGFQDGRWIWSDSPSIDGTTPSAMYTENSDGKTNYDWYSTGFRYQTPALRYILTYTPEVLEYHYYTESLKYMDYLPAEYIPSVIWFTDEQSTVVNRYESDLFGFVNEARANFITGVSDIDSDAEWAAYLDELEVLEVSQWVKAYQDAYTAMMAK